MLHGIHPEQKGRNGIAILKMAFYKDYSMFIKLNVLLFGATYDNPYSSFSW